MALTVADLLVRLSGDPTNFKRDMDAAAKKIEKFGGNLKKTGKTMTTYITLPLAVMGGAAIKAAAEFDSAMSKITGLVGVAREQVEEWKQEILELGPALGKGPRELADAMFFITSAGARGKTALDILTASAKASAAGLGETKDVAFSAGSAVNAYGEANLNAQQAVATLVATVREGNLEAASLAPVLGQVLPVASELGVSFDQLGASIAAMTRIGLSAAESATALRSILSTIQGPTQAAREMMEEFGLSAQALREELREKGLISVLTTLKDAIGDDQEAMKAIIPNVRAMTGVLSLVGKNAEEANKIFESLAKTTGKDLTDAFKEAEKQDLHKFRQALAEVQAAMVELGHNLLPIVVPLIEDLASGVKSLGEWLKALSPAQQTFVTNLGLIAIGTGPVLFGLGAITSVLGKMAGVMGTTATATWGVVTAFEGAKVATGAELALLKALPVVTLAAKAGLVGLTGVLSYQLTKSILEATGAYAAMGKVLGLEAGPPLEEFTEHLMDNKDAFDQQLATYNKMRESVGALGEEWAIASDHSDENAERLAKLTVELEGLAREAAAAKRETDALAGAITVVAGNAGDNGADQVKKFTDQIELQTEALKEEYDLLSKEDVAGRLQKLADEYKRLVDSGINAEQVAAAQSTEMLHLLDLHEQYGLEAPESVKKYAAEMEKSGVPMTQEMLDRLASTGTYVSVGMKKVSEMGEELQKQVANGISGGFGLGIEDGIPFADQAIEAWKIRLGHEPIKMRIQLDTEEADRAIEDYINGNRPRGGGSLP